MQLLLLDELTHFLVVMKSSQEPGIFKLIGHRDHIIYSFFLLLVTPSPELLLLILLRTTILAEPAKARHFGLSLLS